MVKFHLLRRSFSSWAHVCLALPPFETRLVLPIVYRSTSSCRLRSTPTNHLLLLSATPAISLHLLHSSSNVMYPYHNSRRGSPIVIYPSQPVGASYMAGYPPHFVGAPIAPMQPQFVHMAPAPAYGMRPSPYVVYAASAHSPRHRHRRRHW
ncbi:hypothetical protein BJV78DRAFT_248092 [Lactifluus subvellereus]|nr:hypothetical protein BJV78DRAFT_248092 [Lactifluus subvellereus]